VQISALWIILTLFLFFYKRPFVLTGFLLIIILTALFLINLIAGGTNWFLPVGLPVTVAGFVVSGAIIAIYKTARLKGLNIIASALIVLSGFCVILELILDKFLKGKVDLRWSLIAAVSILPVALVLYHYHYRLKKGNRLDSFFHV
jgi:peptidoglycan/LPS O-acetylase OafA/YrhL